MRKPNIDELQADNTDLKEGNKRLSNRIQSLIQEANDLRIENNELREWNESLMKELSELRADIERKEYKLHHVENDLKAVTEDKKCAQRRLNSILEGEKSSVIVDLIEENEVLRAKIRVNGKYGYQSLIDTDMAERIKTLETVNKRHQEEIKKLRGRIKEMAELLEEQDALLEIAIKFLE